MSEILAEDEVAELVDRVRATPARRGELVDLLHEGAAVYHGRGTSTTARIRAWVLAAFEDVGLPDEALPFVLEELESGREPALVAAAAKAVRGRPAIDAPTAGFLVRALFTMADLDEPVSFEAMRPRWPAARPTSALLEILTSLRAADGGPAVRAELEGFRRDHAALLCREVRDRLEDTIAALPPVAAPCCGTPGGRPVAHDGRDVDAGPLPPGVELEDQDGTRLACADFFLGRPTVLAFFYTRCTNPNKCSLTVTKLAALQRTLDRDDVAIAAVTYDPGFDLPGRLRRYGSDRGLRFGPSTRMFRAVAGHDALRDHFALRVGYRGSVVNRHGIELFLLDHRGAVRHTWSRVQWDPADVLDRVRALDRPADKGGEDTLRVQEVPAGRAGGVVAAPDGDRL